MNQHAPHPDKLVGQAGVLVLTGLERGFTFTIYQQGGKTRVEVAARPGVDLSVDYGFAVAELADEVAYLVKA